MLDSYDSERRPACTRNMLMATAYYEGQAQFNTGLTHIDADSAEGERTRASIGPQVMAHVSRVFQTLGLQIGIRYEDSPICISDGTPAPADDPAVYLPLVRAGWRAPHDSRCRPDSRRNGNHQRVRTPRHPSRGRRRRG